MHCVIKILFVLAILATSYNRAFCQDDNNQDAWLDSLARTIASMPDDSMKVRRIDSVALLHSNIDTINKYALLELRLADKLQLVHYRIRANSYIGFCYYYKYDFNSALTYYLEMLRISDSIESPQFMAKSRHSLASTYAMLGNYALSDKYDGEALRFYEDLCDTANISETIRSLAQTYIDFRMVNTADGLIDKAMHYDSLIGDSFGIMVNLFLRSRVQKLRYDDTDSILYLKRALDYSYRSIDLCNDQVYLFSIYQALMMWYIDMSKVVAPDYKNMYLDSAQKYHTLAVEYGQLFGVKDETPDLILWEAVFKRECGDFNGAYQIFKTIEANYAQDSLYCSEEMIDFYNYFSDFYVGIENYKSALAYRIKADKIRDKIYNREFVVETTRNNAERQHEVELESHRKTERINKAKLMYAFVALGSIVVLLIFVMASYVKNQRTNKILLDSNVEIEMQRDQLKAVNDEITSSIRYAKKIQEASVPQKDIMDAMFGGCLIYWQPLEIVSGDFYWAQQTQRYQFLAVGDCTGHGVPGAFMSMLGISSLNDIVLSIDFDIWKPSAGQILDVLRSMVISSLRQSVHNEEDTKDGMDLALCIIDNQKSELHFAGAMRPLFIFRNGECMQFSGDRMPVGVSFKQDIPFTNYVIQTQKDDVVYIFTDGVVDQFGYLNGVETKFTRKRLKELLMQIHSMPFAEQWAYMESVFDEWASPKGFNKCRCPQVDDQLLIGIRL